MAARPPWNHNIHYHPLILAAIPPGTERALDVGCGEGLLARELRRVVPHVSAIDADAPVLGRARRADGGAGVRYLHGDFLTYPFPPESFDAVVSIAALHHMDAAAALPRMCHLLRPGGKLAIVGLARTRHPADLAVDLTAIPVNLALRARRGYRDVTAPTIWPPPQTYGQVRRLARTVLPGARYRRHLLWRYSLVWAKPAR